MRTVSIDELQSHLPDLLRDAVEGEQFSVVENGHQLARLVKDSSVSSESAGAPPVKTRRLGAMKGMFTVPDDFDTFMQAEIEEMFYGKE